MSNTAYLIPNDQFGEDSLAEVEDCLPQDPRDRWDYVGRADDHYAAESKGLELRLKVALLTMSNDRGPFQNETWIERNLDQVISSSAMIAVGFAGLAVAAFILGV